MWRRQNIHFHIQCTNLFEANGWCTPIDEPIARWNPLEQASPFQTGWRENYGLSVSGGTDATTYYIGADYEREEGVIDYNRLRRLNSLGSRSSSLYRNSTRRATRSARTSACA